MVPCEETFGISSAGPGVSAAIPLVNTDIDFFMDCPLTRVKKNLAVVKTWPETGGPACIAGARAASRSRLLRHSRAGGGDGFKGPAHGSMGARSR